MPIINEKSFEDKVLENKITDDGGLAFYYRTRFIPEVSEEDFYRISNYLATKDKKEVVNHYKQYNMCKKISLPSRTYDLNDEYFKTIFSRKSIRNFSGEEIKLDIFSQLITASYGINNTYLLFNDGSRLPLRTVPSAGGLFPIEFYIAIFNVENIPKGIYHYNPIDLTLELMESGDYQNEIISLYQGSNELKNSSAVIMMTSVFNRTVEKYGERGWRFIFLDAGHIGQNIYLTATKLGIGVFTMGGGFDSSINRFLNINETNEVYIYGAAIGSIDNYDKG